MTLGRVPIWKPNPLTGLAGDLFAGVSTDGPQNARAMRGLLIDPARRQQALKRGAGFHITLLNTKIGEHLADDVELSRLSEAIEQLAKLGPHLAVLVDLKYFCGFSFAEIAAVRGISTRTAQRDWEKARLILFRHLEGPRSGQ